MDVLSPSARSYCMSQIRSKHTKPERQVRTLLHRLGCRYRVHVRALPGSPDIVLPSRMKIILVHGCFWHRHRCKFGRPRPMTRRKFWHHKLEKNKIRDTRNRRKLRKLGWRVLVIWECQLRDLAAVERKLTAFLES